MKTIKEVWANFHLFDGEGGGRSELLAGKDGGFWALGTDMDNSFLQYVDADGTRKNPIMGCYGIGVGRLAATICEEQHDNFGPIWPMSITKFLCSRNLRLS